MTGYGGAILPVHIGQLAGISEDVARERGYVSVDTKRRLDSAGFKDYQRRVPGLLIPVHDTSGAVALWQYRPDSPRVNGKGKPVKYETPGGSRMILDVPPRIRPQLGDPKVALWITEGIKKADAAVSAGLCCVALLGVWNWKGTNTLGGRTALPEFHDIAWNDGRRVYVAYDSDVMTNPQVHAALADIGGYLACKGADVRYCYLPADGDAKVGLDDYLAAGGSVDALITSATPEPREAIRHMPAAEPQPEPAPAEPVDGAALLDDVARFLCGYVAFPSGHAAVAVALWAAHTHLVSEFESTPRLALLSPEKQCGKSRVLELLELLSAGAETLSDASPAYLYRRIGAGQVTILLDEADAIWKRGKSDETAEALRSIVNAGHRRSATVGRVEMTGQAAKLTRFRVYAPAAVAGIGTLPDTIMDRAVVIRMRRRAPGEQIRDYRERTTRPEGDALRDQLAAWAAQVKDRVGCPWPDMPPGVADRPADVWEPLLAVADLAGGDWPKRATEACTAFVAGGRDDTESLGTRLLADVRAVWPSSGTAGTSGTSLASHVPLVPLVPHLGTDDLLHRLRAIEEAPWGDWYGHPLNPRDLARLLKPYGVASAKVRIGEDSVRGYRAADLRDAWQRYGAGSSPATCTVCGYPLRVYQDGKTRPHPDCETEAGQ